MKNFIFKSQKDFHKIVFLKLEAIQNELRHQREDHRILQRDIEAIRMDLNLQRQADSYYDDHGPPSTQGTLEDMTKSIPEEQ